MKLKSLLGVLAIGISSSFIGFACGKFSLTENQPSISNQEELSQKCYSSIENSLSEKSGEIAVGTISTVYVDYLDQRHALNKVLRTIDGKFIDLTSESSQENFLLDGRTYALDLKSTLDGKYEVVKNVTNQISDSSCLLGLEQLNSSFSHGFLPGSSNSTNKLRML